MFDINEIEGKIKLKILENGIRVVEEANNKSVYLVNNKTDDKYKFTFNKYEDGSYRAIMSDDSSTVPDIERTINANGRISIFFCKSVISVYLKDDKIHMVAPEQFDIFE